MRVASVSGLPPFLVADRRLGGFHPATLRPAALSEDGDGRIHERQDARPGAYRVLARKYRPQSFADLIGQEPMVRTLTNAFAPAASPRPTC